MKNIIAIGGQKGGVGKSTIATNLAVKRQIITSKDVLIIDADDQGSASFWASRRSEKSPNLKPLSVVKKFGAKDFIDTVRSLSQKYDDIIIDVGGRNTFELRAAMIVANKFFLPLKPSQLDVETIGVVESILSEAMAYNYNLEAKIIPSMVSVNPMINELQELLDLKEDLENLKMCDAVIRERITYRKVTKTGKSIFEADSLDEKAIGEFNQLYFEIYGN